MAGRQDIQRFPKGLISVLGMTATGDTPHKLAEEVQPNLNLLDYYLLDRTTQLAFTSGVIAAAGVTTCGPSSGPPAGKAWLVYDVSFQLQGVGAGATIWVGLGVIRQGTVANCIIFPGMYSGRLIAGESTMRAVHFEQPMILRPGDVLGVRTIEFTGAPAATVFGDMYYVEIGV
jgi:hypothetical protein